MTETNNNVLVRNDINFSVSISNKISIMYNIVVCIMWEESVKNHQSSNNYPYRSYF